MNVDSLKSSSIIALGRNLYQTTMIYLVLLFGGLVLWQAGTAIYHLWFSPLANFPGPKLAAGTLLYEFYYEVICSGQYTRRIEKMHEKYGQKVLDC